MLNITRRAFLTMAAGAGITAIGLSRHPQPLRTHYPAIVVGSGYGGGVSALRLGQAGVRTPSPSKRVSAISQSTALTMSFAE
jgi:cholesterol oxidase